MPILKVEYENDNVSFSPKYEIKIACTSLYEHYNNFKKFNLNSYVCAMQQIYPSTQRIWDYDEAQNNGLKLSKYNDNGILVEQYRLVRHQGVFEYNNGQYRYINSPAGMKIYLKGNSYDVTNEKWGYNKDREGYWDKDDYGNSVWTYRIVTNSGWYRFDPGYPSYSLDSFNSELDSMWDSPDYSLRNVTVFDSAWISVGSGNSGWANVPFHDGKINLVQPGLDYRGGNSSTLYIYKNAYSYSSNQRNYYKCYYWWRDAVHYSYTSSHSNYNQWYCDVYLSVDAWMSWGKVHTSVFAIEDNGYFNSSLEAGVYQAYDSGKGDQDADGHVWYCRGGDYMGSVSRSGHFAYPLGF